MYNPVQESLENCQFVINKLMDAESITDEKIRMVLYGFLATVLSPLFAFVYIVHGILRVASMLVPLISLLIMLAIGLPLLTISKCIYGIYKMICSVLLHFYMAGCDGTGTRTRTNSRRFIRHYREGERH